MREGNGGELAMERKSWNRSGVTSAGSDDRKTSITIIILVLSYF